MKASFLNSTLSLMTLICLLTVVYCIVFKVEIQGELLAVITGILGAYTSSRSPNTKSEAEHSKYNDSKPIVEEKSIHDISSLQNIG